MSETEPQKIAITVTVPVALIIDIPVDLEVALPPGDVGPPVDGDCARRIDLTTLPQADVSDILARIAAVAQITTAINCLASAAHHYREFYPGAKCWLAPYMGVAQKVEI